jgi:glycosyltransferase involved in cell wall biosynthesis
VIDGIPADGAGTGTSLEPLPFVSVVVPVRNGERTIGDCIVSLLRMDYPAARREILVVDNASTDRTAEIIGGHPVRYLREERRGASRARNHGIEASRGEILAFTDADCLATRGWLRELVNGFAGQDVGGVAGEILPYPAGTAAARYAARIRHLSPQRYLRRPIFPFAVTANLAFRRGVFATVGLFDPDSPTGGESTDFCTRFFRLTSLQLRYSPQAAVFHRHRTTARNLFRQQWNYGKGHAFLYIKYRDQVPWGWRQSARVHRDLARTACALGAAGVRYTFRRQNREDLHFAYFELLRKVAIRAGFLRQALSQGFLYM